MTSLQGNPTVLMRFGYEETSPVQHACAREAVDSTAFILMQFLIIIIKTIVSNTFYYTSKV